MFYFTRHGQIIGTEDKLSEEGKAELALVRAKLAELGFSPTHAFATDKERTLESARILAPGIESVRDGRLRPMGSSGMVLRFSADAILHRLLTQTPDDAHVLMVGHDCVPAVLALRLCEMRGAAIPWKEKWLHYRMVKLRRGQGVLVRNDSFEFISA